MLNGLEPESLYQLSSITQPVFAENRYFFVENHISESDNDYNSQIISVDSNNQKKLWATEGINILPMIIGNTLFYLHQGIDTSEKELMEMPLNGGKAQLIPINGDIDSIQSGNDSLIIKVIQSEETPKYSTNHHPQTRRINRLVNKEDGYGWLPNHARYQILKLDLNSGQITTLLERSNDFNLQSYDEANGYILYSAAVHPEVETDVDSAVGIYLFNLADEKEELLTSEVENGVFSSAKFSPDGSEIAIVGNDNKYSNATVNNFWLYRMEEKSLTNVTKDWDDVDVGYSGGLSTDFAQQRSNVEVKWLDNQNYVFHAYHYGHSQLYGGKSAQPYLIDDQLREIYDFDIINENNILLSSSQATKPCELRRLHIPSDEEEDLYNPNAAFEGEHQYANVTPFDYTSNDHQATIHGWVMHSLENQLKSPVIFYVHGGPHDAYGESFFHEFQVLASQGYSIVYINPRGSTTYGQGFANSVRKRYGDIDYQDVMQGLDEALDQFSDLDASRVFIIGGSYGGYMTTWIIGHSNRFNAAIAQRPLVDWISHYNTSDIGVNFARSALGADLYKDQAQDLYWDNSPIAYAPNVKTPIRLQHGEYDMRCPIGQSEAYFTAVKQTGVDADFIRYPQGYHGISRHGFPNLRIQRMKDIIEWFDKYSEK